MSTNPNDLIFVCIEGDHEQIVEVALYKRDQGTGPWVLVTVEKGERHSSFDTVRALGHGFRDTRLITHLRKGGMWMQVVDDYLMQPTTPVQRIETEIADLRAEADRLDESAAYSGSYGSGAGILTAKADAMQHVLDVLANADDD